MNVWNTKPTAPTLRSRSSTPIKCVLRTLWVQDLEDNVENHKEDANLHQQLPEEITLDSTAGQKLKHGSVAEE